ncbi:ATP-binding protein [Bacteroides sp.]|uniref:sensor histidine kinase n=1 Tax=Bacteroides sp. TaxID=29523 RepID=UPI0023C841AB|nr:ATP-binding protein [Bacteroides sp.]MDE5711929.1 PAS domain-containing sensor histidine kinase [Bacteroides sp.]MDE5760767.1 PAS domain-containing sensor histidine kinase [Bacteroides sp.]MDE6215131.1 PAS domain-containing sensor histidine kinase [Bacteroides sp.]
MRIKFFFYILVLLLIGLGGALIYLLDVKQELHLFLMEGFMALILLYLILFYKKIVKPINSIGNGMELLREQDFSSRLSCVKQHEADRIVNIFNRMMDQLKNERLRLREQNHFLDLLIQASPMGVVILSLHEEVTQLNPMALKMLNIRPEEAIGKRLDQIDSLLAVELSAVPKDKIAMIHLNDANIYKCTHTSFIDQGFKHPFFLIERMTEEVMRAEKQAYEKVIRMIAHEVNNTTAGITSTLDTVEETLSTEKEMEDICDMMRICTERCFSMSRFITRFADVVKIPDPTLMPAQLNEQVSTCKRFMEGMCNDRRIKLRLECDPEVGMVRMDTALFEQVLVNIIKNAVESIANAPDRAESEGEIVVRTLVPASIEVIDNGPGISKEVETKLFNPFFSTKPNGQGIGLVFIREVLTRHNCTFSLRTHSDGLTRFRIQFP